ncbi:hypothetical protein Plhal304r1_c014g0054211 [Plasmopara halstedii]
MKFSSDPKAPNLGAHETSVCCLKTAYSIASKHQLLFWENYRTIRQLIGAILERQVKPHLKLSVE